MSSYAISTMELPWAFTNEDERFKKILALALIIFLAVAIPITLVKLPELTRKEKAELPPQLARVLLEKQELPAPQIIEPPKPEEKRPPPPVEKVVAPKPVEKKAQASQPSDTSIAHPKNPDAKGEAVAAARAQAQAQIATFKDDLMDMRESLQTSAVESAATTAVGSGAAQATQVDRSMINSGQTKGSGGINVGAYASHDVGGVALSGRETTKVKSSLAEAGKKAAGAGAAGSGAAGAGGDAGGGNRSAEEVRRVMDQNSGGISNIYYRALRENATLQGTMVIMMVIEPSGAITDVTIVASELKDPELEAKILQRIKSIRFPAANVRRAEMKYELKFTPQ